MITYWAKLIFSKPSKLSAIAYKLTFSLSHGNNVKLYWMKCIESILNEIGLSYIWLTQSCINEIWLKTVVRTSLQDQFKQTWYSDIQTNSKTLNYRLFKELFGFEKYLDILETRDIYTLCQFRLINHRLPIESGRWNKIQRDKRICELCDFKDLGDEFQCVMKCKFMAILDKSILLKSILIIKT